MQYTYTPTHYTHPLVHAVQYTLTHNTQPLVHAVYPYTYTLYPSSGTCSKSAMHNGFTRYTWVYFSILWPISILQDDLISQETNKVV